MRAFIIPSALVLVAAVAVACDKVTEPTENSQHSYLPTKPPNYGLSESIPTQDNTSVVKRVSSSLSQAEVPLSPIAKGRYLPGYFAQAGWVSVGQGQAGWFSFDISQLAGSQVCGLTLSFTQVGSTNVRFFPITIAIYDVSTTFDRLIVDRIPIDAEGEEIASDLHTGGVYASFEATADGEGTVYEITLNDLAIADLQAAIGRGEQFFSIGLANPDFDRIGYFTPANATLSVSVDCVISVPIDIKPGSDPNSINLGKKGRIPVAILTTDDFDAADVDPATVTIGNDDGDDTHVATRKKGSLMASLEDVDDDGDLDLILHFDTQALVANGDLDANTTELILNGKTTGGQEIQGSDSVNIVPAS